MRNSSKLLLTLIVGLVLILGFSATSQTTDITYNDCKDCHQEAALTIHHSIPDYTYYCTTCHPDMIWNVGEDCLQSQCHVAQVE